MGAETGRVCANGNGSQRGKPLLPLSGDRWWCGMDGTKLLSAPPMMPSK